MFSCGGFGDVNGLLQSTTQVYGSLLDDLPDVFDPVLLVLNTWSLGHNTWLSQINVTFKNSTAVCAAAKSAVKPGLISPSSHEDKDRALNAASTAALFTWLEWMICWLIAQHQVSLGKYSSVCSTHTCTWVIRPHADTMWNDDNSVST